MPSTSFAVTVTVDTDDPFAVTLKGEADTADCAAVAAPTTTEKDDDVTDPYPLAVNDKVPDVPTLAESAKELKVATPLASVVAMALESVADPDVAVNAAVTATPWVASALPSGDTS